MNRRDSIKAAAAGLLGALCPWGAKAEEPERAPVNFVEERETDCECCQMEPASWTVEISGLPGMEGKGPVTFTTPNLETLYMRAKKNGGHDGL